MPPPLPPPAPALSWKLPSLQERLERARQPKASQADVDALVAGLMPGAPRELPPSQYAALVRGILQDPRLPLRTTRDGRTVRELAENALRSLGPPYSAGLGPAPLPPQRLDPSRSNPGLGVLLLACAAGLECFASLGITLPRAADVISMDRLPPSSFPWDYFLVVALLIVGPLLLAASAAWQQQPTLLMLSTWVTGFSCLVRLGFCALLLREVRPDEAAVTPLLLLTSVLMGCATYLLYPRLLPAEERRPPTR